MEDRQPASKIIEEAKNTFVVCDSFHPRGRSYDRIIGKWSDLEEFLLKLIKKHQEELEQALDKRETCNGVSEWMNYGKKMGYYDYWLEQIKN